jgi:hypothetical protein
MVSEDMADTLKQRTQWLIEREKRIQKGIDAVVERHYATGPH